MHRSTLLVVITFVFITSLAFAASLVLFVMPVLYVLFSVLR